MATARPKSPKSIRLRAPHLVAAVELERRRRGDRCLSTTVEFLVAERLTILEHVRTRRGAGEEVPS